MVRAKAGAETAGEQGKHPQATAIHLEPMNQLLSMRMIWLFMLMRRSGSLAQTRLFNLSEIQWRIMTQLGFYAPMSLIGLADKLVQDRGQVSRAVKELVKRGVVSQVRKPGGPEVEISLTPEGHSVYAKLVEGVLERDRRLTEGCEPDELAVVERIVEQMIVRARTMLEEETELSEK